MCADSLFADPRFQVSLVITPSPRKIGRKQLLTKNPLHEWAENHKIPVVLVDKKIDEKVKEEIITAATTPLHFLLVVDFGYLIPKWLLELPTIAPLNIHPSDLPKYRGSSPGQFTLLYGEKNSAVSLIIMNEMLDEGELIHQEKFDVLDTWNAQQYYQSAFQLISPKLPGLITDFGAGNTIPTPQPLESPTPIARRLTREDGYIEWDFLRLLSAPDHVSSPLLKEAHETIHNWPQLIANAVKALSPWPGVWTMVPTDTGEKRMKILSATVESNVLKLGKVQYEGEKKTDFIDNYS